MIYSQLKLYRSELLTKIDNVKDDILTQLQNENQCLWGEIIELKKELDTKSGKIDQIESELEHVKKTLQHKVHLSEFTEVERDVIDLQQYIRRNNIEICGIPESVTKLEKCVLDIVKAVDIKLSASDIEACHRLNLTWARKRKGQEEL